MSKIKSIQANLFFKYSILIASIVIILISFFYKYTADMLEQKAAESIKQVSNYISSQLDSALENMDRISLEVIYSDAVQNNFFQDIATVNPPTLFHNQRELFDILYSIFGPCVPPVRQINLFSLDGQFIGIGSSSLVNNFPIAKLRSTSWIGGAKAKKGGKFISLPHQDDWGSQKALIISLARLFYNINDENKKAVVEVQQKYAAITDIVTKTIDPEMKDKKVYIFNGDGGLVFPYEYPNRNRAKSYWNAVQKSSAAQSARLIRLRFANNKEILTYTCSDYSNWTVVLVESEKILLQPVAAFRNLLFLLSIIILLITLLVSFLVARGLTRPIKRIHQSIKTLSLETLAPDGQASLYTSFNELEELNIAFQDMCTRLKTSLAEVVSARSFEVQARLLALQAQMNPHFLYNTIATISIIAEQNSQTDIVKICEDLSVMLRYILSDTTSTTTIGEEIYYTKCYLNLMKKRYREFLDYQLLIDPGMENIEIPKLIIQPLVENSMKYGINVAPPWRIAIEGNRHDGNWKVSIWDNGQGFSAPKLMHIKERLRTADTSRPLSASNLEGIGLVNIYIRLKLFFGEKAVFEISNHPEGGALIVIGVWQ